MNFRIKYKFLRCKSKIYSNFENKLWSLVISRDVLKTRNVISNEDFE